MSAPVLLGCAAVVVCVGVGALGASNALAVRARMGAAADAAALAAADTLGDPADSRPCAHAREVASANEADLEACRVWAESRVAEVEVRAVWPFAAITARARAGPPAGSSELLDLGRNAGWVWPSGVRGITQDHHDGFAIDLAVGQDGALLAPADGVVVAVGLDPGGIPEPCRVHPDWWRGPNYTVIIRHRVGGMTIYSSHNHIAPGSAEARGMFPGAVVRAGQRVATAGMSGCTSGPHSHFVLSSEPGNTLADIDPFTLIGRPSDR